MTFMESDKQESTYEPKSSRCCSTKRLAIITIIICLVIGALLFAVGYVVEWHVEIYKEPDFAIDGASLTKLNSTKLASHTTLVLINITVTNPNKWIGFNFNGIKVTPYYGQDKKRFGDVVTLTPNGTAPYWQHPRNTTTFQNIVFQGHGEEPLIPNAGNGLYSFDVVISSKEKVGDMSFEVTSNLKLPLSFNRSAYKTKCQLVSEEDIGYPSNCYQYRGYPYSCYGTRYRKDTQVKKQQVCDIINEGEGVDGGSRT